MSLEFVQLFIDSYVGSKSTAKKLLSFPFPVMDDLNTITRHDGFRKTFAVMRQIYGRINEGFTLDNIGILYKPSMTIYKLKTQRFLGVCCFRHDFQRIQVYN
jgi:hypothetical protein